MWAPHEAAGRPCERQPLQWPDGRGRAAGRSARSVRDLTGRALCTSGPDKGYALAHLWSARLLGISTVDRTHLSRFTVHTTCC